ncbi:MAG: hypothetical protein ACJAU1_001759, partial [Psychromonas sp.]
MKTTLLNTLLLYIMTVILQAFIISHKIAIKAPSSKTNA